MVRSDGRSSAKAVNGGWWVGRTRDTGACGCRGVSDTVSRQRCVVRRHVAGCREPRDSSRGVRPCHHFGHRAEASPAPGFASVSVRFASRFRRSTPDGPSVSTGSCSVHGWFCERARWSCCQALWTTSGSARVESVARSDNSPSLPIRRLGAVRARRCGTKNGRSAQAGRGGIRFGVVWRTCRRTKLERDSGWRPTVARWS